MKRKAKSEKAAPKGPRIIFRPWITLRNGKKLYAAQFGLKAFAIKIRADAA